VNFDSKSFLFLLDEKGKVVSEAELLKGVNQTTLTAKSGINYSVALFSPALEILNRKIYSYKVFNNVPNGAKWDLTYTYGFIEGKDLIKTNCIIENVLNYDSLIISGNYRTSTFNKVENKVENESELYYYDLCYAMLREHKDSIYRYAFFDKTNFKPNTNIVILDYNKMKKAYKKQLNITKGSWIMNVLAESNKGFFNLYAPLNYFKADSNLNLFLPQETISNYYVIGISSNNNSVVRWFDKLADLNQFKKPDIDIETIMNSDKSKQYSMPKSAKVVCHHYTTKNDKFQINYEEWSSFDKNKTYKTAIPPLPKTIVNYISDLKSLEIYNEFIETYSFNDKSIDYNIYMNKLLVSNYLYKKELDTWQYKVGMVKCSTH
jgi:hypothetical protein